MKLHIERTGEGKPLVLFHGWGFDHKIWLPLAEELGQVYQLYLVDLPGFGGSSLMGWQLFKQILLEQLPRQFALAGWSLGGLFATRLALEESPRLSHLINIASSPHFIKDEGWPGIERKVFEHFFTNLAANPQQTIAEFIALQLKNQSYAYKNQHQPSIESLEAGLQILADWDFREPLHTYNKPACFMFGRLDAITPRVTMTAMQKRYPNFQYVMFDKAAHMPFLSDQTEFIRVLKQVLQ